VDNYPGEDLKKIASDKLEKIKSSTGDQSPENKQPK